MTVGRIFAKGSVTRTLAADEEMIQLDAAALTQRIGSISHPVKPTPVYHAISSRPEPAQPKWRAYLRQRPTA